MRGESDLLDISNELPRLLIIDDTYEVVELISDLFAEDYNCIKAADGEEGLSKAEDILPDIILCDVRMPKTSGLEVVSRLKNNPQTRYIPIILLSGYNTRENRLEGLRTMADDFIAKPFDYEELRLKMSNILKIRKEMMKTEPQDFLEKELDLDADNYTHEERYIIEVMIEYFSDNYSDKDLNVKQISDYLRISVRQLQRKIKTITKISPMELLRRYRLKQSAQLLLRHKSIAEVSEVCGFSSPNYFCTCFKEYFQETPSKFQKKKYN